MALNNFIKKLRQENDFSQQYLAKKLGVSRPTYKQIEDGQTDLTIEQAKTLAKIFGLSLENFLAEKVNNISVELSKPKLKEKKSKPEIRINVPQQNVEKFKEVLLYVLEKVGAMPNIGETAIYKLLYFIDFDYYEKYEEQLIGAKYIKNHYGPTPVAFKEIVADMIDNGELEKVPSKYFQYEQKKYLPRRKPDLSDLKAQEIQLIDDVLARLANKSARELSEYSHGDMPWQSHQEGEVIDYESVFYRDDRYSVKEHQDEL